MRAAAVRTAHRVTVQAGGVRRRRVRNGSRRKAETERLDGAGPGLCRDHGKLRQQIEEREKREVRILEIANREKTRVGKELHDGLGQQLVLLKFLAAALRDGGTGERKAIEDAAGEMCRSLDQALDTVREITRSLHPAPCGENDLGKALEQLVGRASGGGCFHCLLECPQPMPVRSPLVFHMFYQIAREGLHLVVRHSQGRHVRMTLQNVCNGIRLTIQDDGSGLSRFLETDSSPELEIMRSRAAVLKAVLEIGSTQDGGARIHCLWEPPAVEPPDCR